MMDAGQSSGEHLYDPDARRDTPLAVELKARIKDRGPMPVQDYMRACLYDEAHGYYRQAAAIGADGDFTTSPEISQLFGEILGIWAAVVWKTMGEPERFNLVELGPGRGTLMADALRAAQLVPGFVKAADVILVETNTSLQAKQAASLSAHENAVHSMTWHPTIDAIWRDDAEQKHRPTLIIGNEFLDTAPARQYSWSGSNWLERRVSLDEANRLVISDASMSDGLAGAKSPEKPEFGMRLPAPKTGDIFTDPDYSFLTDVVSPWPRFAALLIDYGHETTGFGDTLQAVRAHKFEHPLTSPGEADLTTQVDFSSVMDQANGHRDDIEIDGPITQAEFLGRLGILQRASKLMALNPDRASEIEASVMRMMAPNGMGTRFKVMGIRSSDVPTLPGLEPADQSRSR